MLKDNPNQNPPSDVEEVDVSELISRIDKLEKSVLELEHLKAFDLTRINDLEESLDDLAGKIE